MAIEILALIGPDAKEAIPALEKASQSSNDNINAAAVQALNAIRSDNAPKQLRPQAADVIE